MSANRRESREEYALNNVTDNISLAVLLPLLYDFLETAFPRRNT